MMAEDQRCDLCAKACRSPSDLKFHRRRCIGNTSKPLGNVHERWLYSKKETTKYYLGNFEDEVRNSDSETELSFYSEKNLELFSEATLVRILEEQVGQPVKRVKGISLQHGPVETLRVKEDKVEDAKKLNTKKSFIILKKKITQENTIDRESDFEYGKGDESGPGGNEVITQNFDNTSVLLGERCIGDARMKTFSFHLVDKERECGMVNTDSDESLCDFLEKAPIEQKTKSSKRTKLKRCHKKPKHSKSHDRSCEDVWLQYLQSSKEAKQTRKQKAKQKLKLLSSEKTISEMNLQLFRKDEIIASLEKTCEQTQDKCNRALEQLILEKEENKKLTERVLELIKMIKKPNAIFEDMEEQNKIIESKLTESNRTITELNNKLITREEHIEDYKTLHDKKVKELKGKELVISQLKEEKSSLIDTLIDETNFSSIEELESDNNDKGEDGVAYTGLHLKPFSSLGSTSVNVTDSVMMDDARLSFANPSSEEHTPNRTTDISSETSTNTRARKAIEYKEYIEKYKYEQKKRYDHIEEIVKRYRADKKLIEAKIEVASILQGGESLKMELATELEVLKEERDKDVIEFKMLEKQHADALDIFRSSHTLPAPDEREEQYMPSPKYEPSSPINDLTTEALLYNSPDYTTTSPRDPGNKLIQGTEHLQSENRSSIHGAASQQGPSNSHDKRSRSPENPCKRARSVERDKNKERNEKQRKRKSCSPVRSLSEMRKEFRDRTNCNKTETLQCSICKGNHKEYFCKGFTNMFGTFGDWRSYCESSMICMRCIKHKGSRSGECRQSCAVFVNRAGNPVDVRCKRCPYKDSVRGEAGGFHYRFCECAFKRAGLPNKSAKSST